MDGLPRPSEHPHAVGGQAGLLLNWNNRSAPGFMHGDDEPYGSVQRVELFDRWPRGCTITDERGVMNRAATEDVRSPVWPVVSRCCARGPAPSARDTQVVALLDDWVSRDAPRLDADDDGFYDERRADDHGRGSGGRSRRGHASRVSANCSKTLNDVRSLGSLSGDSYVDKDLRTPARPARCAGASTCATAARGSLGACRASLWAAI